MGILKKTYTPNRYPRPENPKKNLQFNVVCCWLLLLVGCRQHTQRPPAGANTQQTDLITNSLGTALELSYLLVFLRYGGTRRAEIAFQLVAMLVVLGAIVLFALLVALPGLLKRPEAPPGVVLRQMASEGV